MPWTPDDAEGHTHKATTWVLKELWAKVANETLERTGDEGRAVREANAVVVLIRNLIFDLGGVLLEWNPHKILARWSSAVEKQQLRE
jgi:hypothetical protein